MPLDLPSSVLVYPTIDVLKALTAEELVAIILQQQQLIHRLASCSSGEQIQATLNQGVSQHDIDPTQLHPPSQEPDSEAPYLVVQPEKGTGYTILLSGATCWTIGRDADNGIILTDQWMSRHHAMLQLMDNGEYYLIDLGSRNGTFINSRRVNIPTPIFHGDLITFGQTNIHFHKQSRHLEHTHGLATATQQRDEAITGLLHVRRLISVLVIDIRDFTGLTRQLEEQVLSSLVGSWFRYAGEIIRRHGSWVDKYIGDAVMAVWIHGSWEINVQDIPKPFRALLEIQAMTSQLHAAYGLTLPLQIGAGINTGFAMIGNTGSGDRPDYTALGDTVNAAFRLENSTKQLGVDLAIGPTAYQYLQQWAGKSLSFSDSTVELKGYDTPMQVYAGTFATLAQILGDSAIPSGDPTSA